MANIKDVARLSGVSVSTVSLVINGKKNVSAETYKKIMTAMKELNYRPSMIARNMKKQRLHFIGVVLPSTTGHYAQILKGIIHVVEEHGYSIIVKITDNDIQKEKDVLTELQAIGVSGLAICPADTMRPEKYCAMIQESLPTVFFERKIDVLDKNLFSNVVFNDRKAIYDTASFLLSRCHPEDIALITGPLSIEGERSCCAGFVDAMAGKGHGYVVIETAFERSYAMKTLVNHFDGQIRQKHFIVTSVKMAEVLLEISKLLGQSISIYALGGDMWTRASPKEEINIIPRNAQAMGEQIAGVIVDAILYDPRDDAKNIVIDTPSWPVQEMRIPLCSVKSGDRALKVLALRSNSMDVLRQLSKNYTLKTGVSVEFTMHDFDCIRDALTENGKPFPEHDILFIDIPLIETLGRRGKVLDLEPMLSRDPRNIMDFFPEGIQQCFFKGGHGIYGMPIQACESMLFYRKDIFEDFGVKRTFYEKKGFDLRLPRSWAEFSSLTEYFNALKNPDSPVKYGTSIATMKPTGGFMEEFYIRQRAFNGTMINEWGKLCINSIQNQRALDNMLTAYKNSPPNSFGYFYENVFRDLLNGDIAFAVGFPIHYLTYSYAKEPSKGNVPIGIAPVPGKKHILGAWVLGINAATEMAGAAYEFLTWAVSPDISIVSGLMGGVLPVKNTYKSVLLNEHYPWIKMHDVDEFQQALRETIYKKDGSVLDNYIFENVLAEEFSQAFLGKCSVKEALDCAQVKAEQMINGL